MSPLEAALLAVAVVLVGVWVSWTAGRLDRLHARVDASWAALDAALVRRAAAARTLVPLVPDDRAAALDAAAHDAVEGEQVGREEVENRLTRELRAALAVVPPSADLAELRSAADRVGLARALHNAAVEDTRRMRARPVVRLLRLAGHRGMPTYFEIDDTAPDRRTAA